MDQIKIILVGLGPGNPEALTIGALRALKNPDGVPIHLRTRIHPSVAWLEESEGIRFDKTYDDLYEAMLSFEDVYRTIASDVIDVARKKGGLVYAMPGHPLFGESSAALVIELAQKEGIDVQIVSAPSFIEASFESVCVQTGQMRVADALSLPDFQDRFRFYQSPFDFDASNLIYQVYDRDIASRVKLALLEFYPSDFEAVIVGADADGKSSSVRAPIAELDWPAHHFDHLTSVFVPSLPENKRPKGFASLSDTVARLRDPEKGCPWDVKQTPGSMRANLLEETCETLDAIESGDIDNYIEELGDLLLQIVFHAQMGRESDEFTIDDVSREITEKLIRRHPHVFGDVEVSSVGEVLTNWEAIKKTEKGHEDRQSVLDGVARSLPALARAQKISKKAAKAGFEWDDIDGVFDKLSEETAEFKEAIESGDQERISEELGDMLFTVVNLARFKKVDAEDSLQKMVNRFIKRFSKIEDEARNRGFSVDSLSQPEMESIWREAKREQ